MADRRTLKTKKALSDGLAELLMEKELHKVTVQEIADKAEVNRVTFYKHFLDVYDLYEKMEKDVLVELGLLLLQLEESSSEDVFSKLIEYIDTNRTVFRMIFCPNCTGHLRDKFDKLVEGLFRQIASEKFNVQGENKKFDYLNCYRAQGAIAIISRWVQGGFADPKELIIETATAIDYASEDYMDECFGQ